MKKVMLGRDARGQELFLTPEVRKSTHMHVIGGSGTGKSKFLEWLIRQDIRAGHGLCLIDWHGTLYQDVLRYCSHLDVGRFGDFRSIVLLNPSEPTFITGFNPFMNTGADVSAQVSRRIAATIRPWGITDTDAMPTFERLTRLLYTFAVENGETLPNAAHILQFDRPGLRRYAAAHVSDPYIRDQWRQLDQLRTAKDWREFALSTENRFGRFLGSKAVRRFMGMHEGNLDISSLMDRGAILLVNLGSSDFLDREAARVFASLLLNEFMEAAMRRAVSAPREGPSRYVLYLDEFQEYLTDDVAAMLDQVRKGGLHMVLAHQHLGHFADDPRLKDSILTNARIRAVFGGLSYESAVELGNEMFLPDLNTRQIKKAYYHTIHLYREETRVARSRSSSRSHAASSASGSTAGLGMSRGTAHMSGSPVMASMGLGEGWFADSRVTSYGSSEFSSSSNSSSDSSADSEGEGETEFPVWVPIPVQELANEVEWSREEKLSRVAELLKVQSQRHCFIKIDTARTQPLLVPSVRSYDSTAQSTREYERAIYSAQGAIAAPLADQRLLESAERFLAMAAAYADGDQRRAEDDVIGRE